MQITPEARTRIQRRTRLCPCLSPVLERSMHAELALSTCGRQAERRALTTFAATSGAAAAGRVGACRGAWRGAAACGRPGRPARGRRSRGRRRDRPCGRRGGRGGRRRRARSAPGGRERRAGGPGCRALPWPCRRPWPLPERRRIGRPPGGGRRARRVLPEAAAAERATARPACGRRGGRGRGRQGFELTSEAPTRRPRGVCRGARICSQRRGRWRRWPTRSPRRCMHAASGPRA